MNLQPLRAARRWLPIRLVVGAVSSALVIGCVLFVNDDPSHLTATCNFAGDASACSACVASACQQPLDACCGDSTCSQLTLPLLATCLQTSASDCAGLSVEAPDLVSCITSSCPVCTRQSPEGGSTATSTSCSQDEDACYCIVNETALSGNGMTCNTAGIKGGGLCCASYGWPNATDATCSCQPFSCIPSSLGASCELGSTSTGTTSWPGPGCCSEGTFCDCEPTIGCYASPVTECNVAAIGCAASQIQVESCSF